MKPTSSSRDNEFRASGCFLYGGAILLLVLSSLAGFALAALAQGVFK